MIAYNLAEYLSSHSYFLDEDSCAVLVAYVLLAAYDGRFDTIPYLCFQGPPGSGQSEIGHILAGLAGGMVSRGSTDTELFRWLDTHVGRLLFIDEGIEFTKQDVANILSAGNKRDGVVRRREGPTNTVVSYRAYGPKILIENELLYLPADFVNSCIPIVFNCAPKNFVFPERDEMLEKALYRDVKAWVKLQAAKIRRAYEQWRVSMIVYATSEPDPRRLYAPLYAASEGAGILDNLRTHKNLRGGEFFESGESDPDAALWPILERLKRQHGGGWVSFGEIRFEVRWEKKRVTDLEIDEVLRRAGWRSALWQDELYYRYWGDP